MAKKKEPSISDTVELFKNIMKRGRMESFVSNNRTLMGYNAKSIKFYITIEPTLWNAIMDDEELSKCITEFDITNGTDKDVMGFSYCERPNDGFIEIDPQSMLDGENVDIKVDGYEYDAVINKGIFPLRFKKAEFNNFSYRLYIDKFPILAIRKKWDPIVPDTGIIIYRLFQII